MPAAARQSRFLLSCETYSHCMVNQCLTETVLQLWFTQVFYHRDPQSNQRSGQVLPATLVRFRETDYRNRTAFHSYVSVAGGTIFKARQTGTDSRTRTNSVNKNAPSQPKVPANIVRTFSGSFLISMRLGVPKFLKITIRKLMPLSPSTACGLNQS